MSLFQSGAFILSAGIASKWKIDCDALTDGDWESLAEAGMHLMGAKCYCAYSVPTGGDKLADWVQCRHFSEFGDIIVCDDVLTTGRSMEAKKAEIIQQQGIDPEVIRGLVVFARGACPDWVTPIFQTWVTL